MKLETLMESITGLPSLKESRLSDWNVDGEVIHDHDSIRVYHGTSNPDAILLAITRGINGDKSEYHKTRIATVRNRYTGMSVSHKPDVQKGGAYLIEFSTVVANLQPRAKVYDDYGDKYNQEIDYTRDTLTNVSRDSGWLNSDRPRVAQSLFGGDEAEFIGGVSKHNVKAIWISEDVSSPSGSSYIRYEVYEVEELFRNGDFPTPDGGTNSPQEEKPDQKLFSPEEEPTLEEFLIRLKDYHSILSIIKWHNR